MDNIECVICLDVQLDKTVNCDICKNGICNSCCNKLIDRTFANLNDVSYTCPFCKTRNFRKWDKIDNSIIVNYFNDNEYKLKKQIWNYKDIIFEKDIEIYKLKKIIEDFKKLI
jgi:hypothetical protein